MGAFCYRSPGRNYGSGIRIWASTATLGIERGGVIYSINAIPFGAFVKMLGEEDPTQPGSFARQPKRVRAIVLAAGSGMNFITAGVVFAIAYISGWPTPVDNEVEIAQVVSGTPAEQAGIRDRRSSARNQRRANYAC